jgi:hypothetical protein
VPGAADRDQQHLRAAVVEQGTGNLGSELGAVPVQPIDLARRLRFVRVCVQVFPEQRRLVPESLGQQQPMVAAYQLIARVAEQPAGRCIREQDSAIRVEGQEGVGTRVEEHLECRCREILVLPPGSPHAQPPPRTS